MTQNEEVKAVVKLVQIFSLEFEKALEGSRSSEINTSELCGGAKINSLFHERFPFEIVKMEFDENELRKEIAIAICNIHGIRIGLFTPDLAFDAIVKKQIGRLKEPCLKCVDLVVTEVLHIVHLCTERMTRFPVLRDVVERVISHQIAQAEQQCKDQIKLYIDCQLSYMNTNHEDFIGFANAENQAMKATSHPTNTPGNQVIRKGYMFLHNQSIVRGAKDFWFVLTSENLSWFKDDTEKEVQYILPLNGVKLRDLESKFITRRHLFGLFYSNGRNIYKDNKQLELSCNSLDEEDSWKASLLRAGVYPEKYKENVDKEEEELQDTDPQLKRQVEVIRNLVDSYMGIVTKATKDLIPKTITHMVLNSTKKFISEELLLHVYSNEKQETLMEESPLEVQKREEKMQMYEACKEALNIIGKCSMSFVGQQLSRSEVNISSIKEPKKDNRAANRMSMAIPPPVAMRPAPPPPPGLKRYQNVNHMIPDFYVFSIP